MNKTKIDFSTYFRLRDDGNEHEALLALLMSAARDLPICDLEVLMQAADFFYEDYTTLRESGARRAASEYAIVPIDLVVKQVLHCEEKFYAAQC